MLQQREYLSGEPRLVLLETIREYGLEQLVATGEEEIVRQAHATYYLHLAEEGYAVFWGPQENAWLERFEREHEHLRAALTWLLAREEGEMALRLARALGHFWQFHTHYSEGRTFLERALALSQGEVTPERVQALGSLGWIIANQGELVRAQDLFGEHVTLARQLGHKGLLAWGLEGLAMVAVDLGNYPDAQVFFEESHALYQETGTLYKPHVGLSNLAHLVSRRGEYNRARQLSGEALSIARERGDSASIPYALYPLAEVSFWQGYLAQAAALAEEGLRLGSDIDHRTNKPDLLILLGRIVLQQGDPVRARALGEESRQLLLRSGLTIAMSWALDLLGRVALVQGNYAEAQVFYERSIQIALERGFRWELALGLEGLASAASAQGEPTWAARLWGAAEALRETLGAPLPPVYRADYTREVAAARAQLGEQPFDTAWAQGRGMTHAQVLGAPGRVELPPALPGHASLTVNGKPASPSSAD